MHIAIRSFYEGKTFLFPGTVLEKGREYNREFEHHAEIMVEGPEYFANLKRELMKKPPQYDRLMSRLQRIQKETMDLFTKAPAANFKTEDFVFISQKGGVVVPDHLIELTMSFTTTFVIPLQREHYPTKFQYNATASEAFIANIANSVQEKKLMKERILGTKGAFEAEDYECYANAVIICDLVKFLCQTVTLMRIEWMNNDLKKYSLAMQTDQDYMVHYFGDLFKVRPVSCFALLCCCEC